MDINATLIGQSLAMVVFVWFCMKYIWPPVMHALEELDALYQAARVDPEACLGCGVCVPACPRERISLVRRTERVLTPLNTAHRTVLMAIERGKLQHLIFDNHALASHRAMAAVLGVILKAPPLKRALARQQMRSLYLDRQLDRGLGCRFR